MREIEFRGKSVISGKWVYGWLNATTEEDGEYYWIDKCLCAEDGTDYSYQVDPETIGQYTGLKDKNGKRIFEGDIVEINTDDNSSNINGFKGVVVYENTSFMLNEIGCDCFETLNYWESELEIIGNIWDNKELLEEQDVKD